MLWKVKVFSTHLLTVADMYPFIWHFYCLVNTGQGPNNQCTVHTHYMEIVIIIIIILHTFSSETNGIGGLRVYYSTAWSILLLPIIPIVMKPFSSRLARLSPYLHLARLHVHYS